MGVVVKLGFRPRLRKEDAPDPLMLYGPRPEGRSSLLVQFVISLLFITAFIVAAICVSTNVR